MWKQQKAQGRPVIRTHFHCNINFSSRADFMPNQPQIKDFEKFNNVEMSVCNIPIYTQLNHPYYYSKSECVKR